MENVACEASTALHVVAAKMVCAIETGQRWELWANPTGINGRELNCDMPRAGCSHLVPLGSAERISKPQEWRRVVIKAVYKIQKNRFGYLVYFGDGDVPWPSYLAETKMNGVNEEDKCRTF
jgi:hypothetical protein